MKDIKQILVSFILSFILIYIIGLYCLESCYLSLFDEMLQMVCPVSGLIERSRNENWCTNQYGKYGLKIHDENKLNSSKPKILIYGDSYVEANMLPWQLRIQNQCHNDDYDTIGIGCSGWSSIEYNDVMFRYMKLIEKDILHVVILADINDILNNNNQQFKHTKPRLRQVKNNIFRRFVIKYNANFVYHLYKKFKSLNLNFKINLVSNKIHKKLVNKTNNNYWREMLKEMKDNSPNGNLLFIYVPSVPQIHDNKLDFHDVDKKISDAFQNICLENNVGFINLENQEIRYYKETGRFCRGFPMSRPSAGHCNADGHCLIALAIDGYIKQCNLLK